MSKVRRDPHNIRRNIALNGKYISNDGDSEGILVGDGGIVTVSSALSIKESSSPVNHLDTYGRLWVNNTDPTALYFTNDDGDDIQLTSGAAAIGTISLAADRISVGDAQVNIGTSSGDIVFKSNNSSGTEEWLTFNTNDMTDASSAPVSEILGKSNQRLRIRSQGTQQDLQLMSGRSVQIAHRIANQDYGTSGSSIVRWKNGINFTDATCDYNNDPTIAHNDDNGKIHVNMLVSGNGIPDDAYVGVVSSDTSFELYKSGSAISTTGGNLTDQTLAFTEGQHIRPTVFLGTLNDVWEADQVWVTTVQVVDQDNVGIPAQQRGSTSGSKVSMVISTDAAGLPFTHASPYQPGYNYTQKFTDATCDYDSTSGDTAAKATITHDDDSGAVKIYMSVSGPGIPIGAYVGAVTNGTEFIIHRDGAVVATTGGDLDNQELIFRDRVCFQDPGSTSNYMVLEVDEALDGTVDFGAQTETGLGGGILHRNGYFDMNSSDLHFVANQRLKLMSDSMSNNVVQLDADSVFLAGGDHKDKTDQDYTFVHGGDRMFFGSTTCDTCDIFIDSTATIRRLWIGASNVPNGLAKRAGTSTWEAAGGLEIAVAPTDGETTFQTRLSEGGGGSADMNFISGGEMNFTPLAVGGSAEFSKAYTGTTNATSSLVFIDYDATGNTASGHTITNLALDINLNTDSQTAVGTVNNVGIDLDMVGGTSGTQNNTGINIAVSGADTNYPIITSGGKIGFGVTDPDSALEILHASVAQLKLSYDADSYATIAADSSSNTTITSAQTGTIVLDSGANITLDSHSGAFVAKKAGTQFSVADSAYAGMILGYVVDGINQTPATYTLTASAALVASATHHVSFVAPPSGAVEIEVQINYDAGTYSPILSLSLTDNTTLLLNSLPSYYSQQVFEPARGQNDNNIINKWIATGLTAGDSYKWYLVAFVSSTSGTPKLQWGGDSGGENPVFIMKATALPTAVTDYAIYS